MSRSYFVQSNRQHHPDIDFDRLFQRIGVVATFADKEKWGEQLRVLKEGDRVLMYDQPSGKYIGVGYVDDPWDGSAVTDQADKVAPKSDIEEYQVGVDWDFWSTPNDGYERQAVNKVLGYDEHWATPQAVFSIDTPSDAELELIHKNMAREADMSPELTQKQKEILRLWKKVASSEPAGEEFNFATYDRIETISSEADDFVKNPSEDRFKRMWDRLNSAIQRGRADQILNKWDGSIEELGNVIENIREADSYDTGWEDTLGGKSTVQELFGSLHIEEYPIFNAAAVRGLSFFDYDEPASYTEGAAEFDDFLSAYYRIVGHVTADADHGVTVPIRLEIDQLFNIIHKVDESSIENESSRKARNLYEAILDNDPLSPEPEITVTDLGGESQSVYWVNQGNQHEIVDEYIRAKKDSQWHHDLERVSAGDVIFHNFDDELVGYSIASDQLETYTFRNQEYQRLHVDFDWFEESLSVDDELKTQLGRDEFRLDDYYVLDKNDNLKQAYLSEVSKEAANYLLAKVEVSHRKDNSSKTTESKIPSKPTAADELARQLEEKKQIVFYGPPGTGKTYTADRFAKWWAAQQDVETPVSDRIETVTFHPSFTYEDFIEGLTVESDDQGALEYEIKDGILKQFQEAATNAATDLDSSGDPPRYILIIDEINRGNLAQIFGETITLLEADKRETTKIQLAHSGDESFTLPSNLYIIGTMNTADRSIALVDAALRRRFRFIDIPPEIEVLYDHYDLSSSDDVDEILGEEPTHLEILQALSIRAWERMNDNILNSPDLGKGKQIGHSYLMDLRSPTAVLDAWRYDILPLIEEYHFGQFDRIKQEIFNGTSDPLINPTSERIRSFTLQDLVDALSDFIGVDIQTNFEDVDAVRTASQGDDKSNNSTNYSTYPETFETVQHEIFERTKGVLGAETLTDVSQENVNRRTLRFHSAKDYIPDTVELLFKPEPERNGQMSVHLSSEDDENRVSDVISAHKERYEANGFDVTDSVTYRIVQRTWPLDNAERGEGKEIVKEFTKTPAYEEAIEAFVELVQITDSVFKNSEFATGTPENVD